MPSRSFLGHTQAHSATSPPPQPNNATFIALEVSGFSLAWSAVEQDQVQTSSYTEVCCYHFLVSLPPGNPGKPHPTRMVEEARLADLEQGRLWIISTPEDYPEAKSKHTGWPLRRSRVRMKHRGHPSQGNVTRKRASREGCCSRAGDRLRLADHMPETQMGGSYNDVEVSI